MNILDLKGKKITVMGLGLHGGGVGTVRFLSLAGARVIVTDIKSRDELKPSLDKLRDLKNITYVFNQHRTEDFTKVDMVIKSPSAPWNGKCIKLALENKVPVEIDASLFLKLCKNPVIGVTGTSGKTITASLVYAILIASGMDVVKVGIGQSSVLDKLNKLKKGSVVIFELSSWRLSALGKIGQSPHVAILTNALPDHLNSYRSMDEYVRDKKYIVENQTKKDICIMNWEDKLLRSWEPAIKAQLVKVALQKITVGKSVYVEDGVIYYNNGLDELKIMSVADVALIGHHNIANVLLAIATAISLNVKGSDIKKAVTQFKGVAHRLELVRDLKGVSYYNDSAATTPESAIAAIQSFSKPIVLIGGGTDKKLDMAEFAKTILQTVKSVVLLRGTATDKLITEMVKADHNRRADDFVVVESMSKAVELARKEAAVGDIVLLSPGAAGFGLFHHEFDRGDQFRSTVLSLK